MASRFFIQISAITAAVILAAACCDTEAPAQFAEEAPQPEIADKVLHKPKADAKAQTVTLPAAFWDQHLTGWVEVAVCGRPSEFLHETLISIFTTRRMMEESLREAGFRDADHWVSSVQDFPRIRGDRALVLLEVEIGGKKETFAMDELLAYQNMGVSIGPFGWMYKGDPERKDKTPATTKAADPKIEAASEVLGDDPQVALQFKGIRGLSRSFMDHPLCYDNWVYPVVRYQRNRLVQPRVLAVPKTKSEVPLAPIGGVGDGPPKMTLVDDDAATSLRKFWEKIFDSNGKVAATMTIAKVTEEQLITQMAKHWHDEGYAKHITAQIGTAKQIDADKAALEKKILAVRALIEKGKAIEDVRESNEFAEVALMTAKVEAGYSALDAAWVTYSMDHTVMDGGSDPRFLDSLKEQARLWREHMVDWKDRAAQLADAEQARFDLRPLAGAAKENAARIQVLRGKELSARSRALQLEIRHILRYWNYENDRLTPDETRVFWVRSIKTQLELFNAKEAMAKTGIALGDLMQKAADEKEITTARDSHGKAVTRATLADLNADLAVVEFEIDRLEPYPDDPELPKLKERQGGLVDKIKKLVAATQPK